MRRSGDRLAVMQAVEGVHVNPLVLDGQAQVPGKCQYWRERMHEDDRWNTGTVAAAKHVRCSCFIEGRQWETTAGTLPEDCPDASMCRYHVLAW